MAEEFEDISQFRVYAENTDFQGIVFHADYLHFFERARTEMLRTAGISLTEAASHGTNFAIRNVHIRYHKPAHLDELLTIKSMGKIIRASIIQFDQSMRNQQEELIAAATIEVVCISDRLKPKRLPEKLIKFMKNC